MLWATAPGRALSLVVTKPRLDNDGQQVCWSLPHPWWVMVSRSEAEKWPRANIYSFPALGHP